LGRGDLNGFNVDRNAPIRELRRTRPALTLRVDINWQLAVVSKASMATLMRPVADHARPPFRNLTFCESAT
jgi:hypothetical protein